MPSRKEIRSEKKRLRAQVLAARDAMGEAARAAASARITQAIFELPAYRMARGVCAYMSFGSEFDTAALIANTRALGQTLFLPRIDRPRRTLSFHRVADPAQDLVAGTWGILEPDPNRCPATDLEALDFMLVPGVAFSRECDRLGYGGGYYDRVLARVNTATLKIAAAFYLQIVPTVPTDASDRKVDVVLTERGRYGRLQSQQA